MAAKYPDSSSTSSEGEYELVNQMEQLNVDPRVPDGYFEGREPLPGYTEFLSRPDFKKTNAFDTKIKILENRERPGNLTGVMPLANRRMNTVIPFEETHRKHFNIYLYGRQVRDIMNEITTMHSAMFSDSASGQQAYDLSLQILEDVKHLRSIKNFCAPSISETTTPELESLGLVCSQFETAWDHFLLRYGEVIRNCLDVPDFHSDALRYIRGFFRDNEYYIRRIYHSVTTELPPHKDAAQQLTCPYSVASGSEQSKLQPTTKHAKIEKQQGGHNPVSQRVKPIDPSIEVNDQEIWTYAQVISQLGARLEYMIEWLTTGGHLRFIVADSVALCIRNHVQLVQNIYRYARLKGYSKSRGKAREDPEIRALGQACYEVLLKFYRMSEDDNSKPSTTEDIRRIILEEFAPTLRQICGIIKRKMPKLTEVVRQSDYDVSEAECRRCRIPFSNVKLINRQYRQAEKCIVMARNASINHSPFSPESGCPQVSRRSLKSNSPHVSPSGSNTGNSDTQIRRSLRSQSPNVSRSGSDTQNSQTPQRSSSRSYVRRLEFPPPQDSPGSVVDSVLAGLDRGNQQSPRQSTSGTHGQNPWAAQASSHGGSRQSPQPPQSPSSKRSGTFQPTPRDNRRE